MNYQNYIYILSRASFYMLYEELAQAMKGLSDYTQASIEAAIYKKMDCQLFQDGTIIGLDFPTDTPAKVKERVVRIHAEVCAKWGS